MNNKKIKHKRIGGNRLWSTLCGYFGQNATWRNTWKAVNCNKCKKLKGSSRDFLRKE